MTTPTPSMRQALEWTAAALQGLADGGLSESSTFTISGTKRTVREILDEADAALGAPSEQPQKEVDAAPVLPDGWKLVPIKPTRDMINDGIFTLQEWDARTGEDYGMEDMWVAMLAAAPKPIPGRTADIELPPLPELCGANPWRMSAEQAREYARAAVLHDRQKQPQKEIAGWRIRHRSKPGMIGHYPWSYTDRIRGGWLDSQYEYEPLYTAPQQPAQGQDAKQDEVDCPGCGKWGEPNGKDGDYRCGSGYQGGCTR